MKKKKDKRKGIIIFEMYFYYLKLLGVFILFWSLPLSELNLIVMVKLEIGTLGPAHIEFVFKLKKLWVVLVKLFVKRGVE